MPDALGAWPSLTARETLVVTAKLYRIPADGAGERAATLLDTVGLADLADAPARVLSRGQKQRLGLARALVHDPSVLLLDEPASGLDPEARIHLRTLLRGLAAEGRTILVSSHVLSELDELADDAVFMVRGETVSGDRVAAASTRSREWRIRIADVAVGGAPGGASPRRCRACPTRLDRRDVVVPFASEGDAARALGALVAAGLAVSEFAPVTGDLEHTFLDLGARPQPGTGAHPGTEGGAGMSDFLHGTWTIAALELRQRVRSLAWYVLLGIFAVLLIIVTVLASAAFSRHPTSCAAPTPSSSTSCCCSWCSSRRRSAATPSTATGMPRPSPPCRSRSSRPRRSSPASSSPRGSPGSRSSRSRCRSSRSPPSGERSRRATLAVSIVVLLIEIAVVAAFGVGLSGILNRPLFSVVATYLVVAALTIGTLIAFGLGGSAVRSEVVQQLPRLCLRLAGDGR